MSDEEEMMEEIKADALRNGEYRDYHATIYGGDDQGSALLKIQQIGEKFPGCSVSQVDGEPGGLCQSVDGPDKEVCLSIENWINSEG